MTINNPEMFAQSVWDWGFLDICFGSTGIKVSDLDGIVERYGRFLVIETKLQIGTIIPEGQRITLEALVDTGLTTVIILRGRGHGDIIGWEIWHKTKSGLKKEYREGGADKLVECVRAWFVWACGKPGKWCR